MERRPPSLSQDHLGFFGGYAYEPEGVKLRNIPARRIFFLSSKMRGGGIMIKEGTERESSDISEPDSVLDVTEYGRAISGVEPRHILLRLSKKL